MLAQLADAGRLTGAVHARDHDHHRLFAAEHHGFFQGVQQFDQQIAQGSLHAFGRFDALCLDAAAQFAEQVFGGVDTGIGHQQRGFQLFEQRFVHLHADEERGQALARLRQSGAQA